MKKTPAGALFLASFVVSASLAAAVAIYGLGHYERMWGSGVSLQVSIWLIVAVAAFIAPGFWWGIRKATAVSWWKPTALGVAFSLLLPAIPSLFEKLGAPVAPAGGWTFLVLMLGLSFLAGKLAS